MNKNAMFVDHYEDLAIKRVEFREQMRKILIDAFVDGALMENSLSNEIHSVTIVEAEEYADEKLKELF